jgi:Zn-dependent peptidase ImmA (M78 family)
LRAEVIHWRFGGRLREVVIEGCVGIDDRLSEPWKRWLTAHALGHHLLHTGTSLYLESWQWVGKVRAERQAEEFEAGLLCEADMSTTTTAQGLARRAGIPEIKAVFAIQLGS